MSISSPSTLSSHSSSFASTNSLEGDPGLSRCSKATPSITIEGISSERANLNTTHSERKESVNKVEETSYESETSSSAEENQAATPIPKKGLPSITFGSLSKPQKK